MLDDTDKGDALRALVEESGADRAVVLGDDVTDEWAFAAAGADDVTVKVGAGETGARFRVATVPDAVAVLAFLASQRAASQRASAQADEVPSHDRSNDGRPGTASG
jgi:trehalose 6-phosphate phosphatase